MIFSLYEKLQAGSLEFALNFFFFSRGNRHPLPPPLAQNVNSARQREEKGLDGAPSWHDHTLDPRPEPGQVHHSWPDNHGEIVLPVGRQ